MTIDWHFPRKDLTENVLTAYETGPSNTLTLFAPRRMGKTEFVLYDLIPAATERVKLVAPNHPRAFCCKSQYESLNYEWDRRCGRSRI